MSGKMAKVATAISACHQDNSGNYKLQTLSFKNAILTLPPTDL
jgi:hypothetical protein